MSPLDEIVGECLAVRVRLIGRAVTNIYDGVLGRHGLTVAQVNLLAALGKIGPCAPSRLGELLQLERSTVSRNVTLLMRSGWVDAVSSDAKGVREIVLTGSGRRKVAAVLPEWRQAQRQAAELLGPAGTRAIHDISASLGHLAEA